MESARERDGNTFYGRSMEQEKAQSENKPGKVNWPDEMEWSTFGE